MNGKKQTVFLYSKKVLEQVGTLLASEFDISNM